MKCLAKIFTVFVLCIFLASSVFAVDGLLAYYSFNDEANLLADSSGNGHDLTAPDGGVSAGEGKMGKGAVLDGETGYMHWENLSESGAEQFTFAFWVNFNDIYSQSLNTMFSGDGWTENPGCLHCHMKNDGFSAFGFSDMTPDIDVTNSDFEEGTWYHIAFTVDTAECEVKYYINGELDQEAIISGQSPVYLGSGSIGCWNNLSTGPERFCNATFDEIKFYTRALSADEVKTIMNEESAVEIPEPETEAVVETQPETAAPAEEIAPAETVSAETAAIEPVVAEAPQTADTTSIILAAVAVSGILTGIAYSSRKK